MLNFDLSSNLRSLLFSLLLDFLFDFLFDFRLDFRLDFHLNLRSLWWLSIGVNFEEWFSHLYVVSLLRKQLSEDSCLRTPDVDGDLIGLDVGYDFIECNIVSNLCLSL
jgi:hypothetical protein